MHHFNIESSIYMLDYTEPEPEELIEQAPVKATNTELAQGKP
jgi:hypothetical protein